MKFDLFSWQEVNTNEEIEAGKGWLRLRCSSPAPLYFKASGHEVLADFGTAFEVELAEEVNFRLDAPKGVRLFRYLPDLTAVAADGEAFTNLDRMVQESGTMAEINKAVRLFKLEQNAALREMRAERAQLDAARAAAGPLVEAVEADASPALAPDPAPAPDPAVGDAK